jgi:hypothetical protein
MHREPGYGVCECPRDSPEILDEPEDAVQRAGAANADRFKRFWPD